jgi:hypothetical protein
MQDQREQREIYGGEGAFQMLHRNFLAPTWSASDAARIIVPGNTFVTRFMVT